MCTQNHSLVDEGTQKADLGRIFRKVRMRSLFRSIVNGSVNIERCESNRVGFLISTLHTYQHCSSSCSLHFLMQYLYIQWCFCGHFGRVRRVVLWRFFERSCCSHTRPHTHLSHANFGIYPATYFAVCDATGAPEGDGCCLEKVC